MSPAPGAASRIRAACARLMCAAIRAYQLLLAPVVGPRCRHLPGCSEYAMEAIRLHGPLAGSWLAVRRLARCQPFGTSGYDPVPAPASNDDEHPAPRT